MEKVKNPIRRSCYIDDKTEEKIFEYLENIDLAFVNLSNEQQKDPVIKKIRSQYIMMMDEVRDVINKCKIANR